MPNVRLRGIKKAITLVEITVALIIVGILATLAMPIFTKTLETARGREAEVALEQIWAGERIYRTGENFYFPKSSATESSIPTINTNLDTELDGSARRNWNFSITSTTDNSFTATATRTSGRNSGETIDIDQTGQIDKSGWTP